MAELTTTRIVLTIILLEISLITSFEQNHGTDLKISKDLGTY